MEKENFKKDLEKRTRMFSVKIIRLSSKLPKTTEGNVIRNQIINFKLFILNIFRAEHTMFFNFKFATYNFIMSCQRHTFNL